MNYKLMVGAVLAALAWPGAQAANQWGPYNAQFPAASDGLLKKVTQADIFAPAGGEQATQPFALSGWFKPSEVAPGRTPIAGIAGAQAGPGWFLCSVDGKFGFCGYGVEVVSPLVLAADAWVHLAASYDGRQLTLYADGRVVARKD